MRTIRFGEMLGLVVIATAPPLQAWGEVFDPAVEAYRGCLSSFEEPAQLSKATGVVVIGANRPNPGKPKQPRMGVYSITPGGLVYFHECAPAGARLAYPIKISPQQQDYAPPNGSVLEVKNVSLDAKKYPGSWQLSKVGSTAVKCEGARVKDAAIAKLIRKRIEDRVKVEGTKFNQSRLVEEAAARLKKKHPEKGQVSGRVTKFSFSEEEMRQEKLLLLKAKIKPLKECRDSLAALKPSPSAEEKALISKVDAPLGALRGAYDALEPEKPSKAPNHQPTGKEAGGAI